MSSFMRLHQALQWHKRVQPSFGQWHRYRLRISSWPQPFKQIPLPTFWHRKLIAKRHMQRQPRGMLNVNCSGASKLRHESQHSQHVTRWHCGVSNLLLSARSCCTLWLSDTYVDKKVQCVCKSKNMFSGCTANKCEPDNLHLVILSLVIECSWSTHQLLNWEGYGRACNRQSLIYCQAVRQCCSQLKVPTKFSLLSYLYIFLFLACPFKGNVKPGSCSSIVAESWVSDSYSSPWSSSCFWRTFSLVARCQEIQTPPWLSPIFSTTAFIWSNNQGANVIMTSKLCHGLGQTQWKWTELCRAAGSYQHIKIRVPLFPPHAKENSHQNHFRFTTPPCNFYCQFILSVSGKH